MVKPSESHQVPLPLVPFTQTHPGPEREESRADSLATDDSCSSKRNEIEKWSIKSGIDKKSSESPPIVALETHSADGWHSAQSVVFSSTSVWSMMGSQSIPSPVCVSGHKQTTPACQQIMHMKMNGPPVRQTGERHWILVGFFSGVRQQRTTRSVLNMPSRVVRISKHLATFSGDIHLDLLLFKFRSCTNYPDDSRITVTPDSHCMYQASNQLNMKVISTKQGISPHPGSSWRRDDIRHCGADMRTRS